MATRLGYNEYCFICATNILLKSASLIMSIYLIKIIHIIILYIININNIYLYIILLIHVVCMCHWLTQDKNSIHVLVLYIVFTKSNFIQPTMSAYDKPINHNLLQSPGCACLTLLTTSSITRKYRSNCFITLYIYT